MKKLYYDFPYVREFQAVVVSCQRGKNDTYEVVLDQTGFYPGGGGQPGDTGVLGTARVLDVHERSGRIIHSTDLPLPENEPVKGAVAWEKRYGNMQNHTGEHLFSGLVHNTYGYDNVGFHMGKDEITVDFSGILTMDQVLALEQAANEKIYENLPVIETYPNEQALSQLEYRSKKELTGEVRIIEIPACDVCACCGTHVRSTGEIGMIKVTGLIRYKGGVRISLLCGMRALMDYRNKQDQISAVSGLLSVPAGFVAEAVEKMKAESGQKDWKISQLYLELFTARTMSYAAGTDPLMIFEQGLAPVQLRQFCTMLYEQDKGNAVLVCSGEEGHYQYALGSRTMDVRQLAKKMNEYLQGRGGGSALLVQGTFPAGRQEIVAAFNKSCK